MVDREVIQMIEMAKEVAELKVVDILRTHHRHR